MDKFHEREKAYEDKFIHDAEIEFKITIKTHKKVGLWVAEKLSLSIDDSKSYANNFMNELIDQQNNFDKLIQKIAKDFKENNIAIDIKEVTKEYDRLKKIAYHEIMKK